MNNVDAGASMHIYICMYVDKQAMHEWVHCYSAACSGAGPGCQDSAGTECVRQDPSLET